MKQDILEILYKKYYASAYHYTLSLTRNKHITEDIVSKAFIKAFVTVNDVEIEFKYWLLRVCKNLWIDEIRREKYVSDEMDGDFGMVISPEDIENRYIVSERNKMLYGAIFELQQNYREVLILFYFADLSIQSIAKITKHSVNNTKTILCRARSKLRLKLEGKGYEI